MSPFASWILVTVFIGGPTLLLWSLMRIAGKCSREEEEMMLHTHTCSTCGRVQRWIQEFDQTSPCRACQLDERRHIEIDLETFADADALADFLNGAAEVVKPLETSNAA